MVERVKRSRPKQFLRHKLTNESGRHYVVTKVMHAKPGGGFHPSFGGGAEIVSWGVAPDASDIDFHAQEAAGRLPGGNCAASLTGRRFIAHCGR